MPNCVTVNCIATYSCGAPIQPIDGAAVMTPYVEIGFGGVEKMLMTGNQSAPLANNHAAIKSFELGFTPGQPASAGFKAEILDEGGTMYKKIVAAINKSVQTQAGDTKGCYAKWGWIVTSCNDEPRIITNEDYGQRLHFLPKNVETVFENGLVKLTIETAPPTWTEVRLTNNLGDEDNKMPLRQALQQLFTEKDPAVNNVRFLDKDGTEDGLRFKTSDGDAYNGPRGVWPMDQQNALAIARKWLSSITTADGKGILILYDPENVKVVFHEDPGNSSASCCGRSLGTYIVNGGNCSPVISFNPTMKWWPAKGNAPGSGGTAPGASGGQMNEEIQPVELDIERTGAQTGPTVQQSDWTWRIPDDMASRTNEAFIAHLQAEVPYSVITPIEAELKIIGDPSFNNPVLYVAKWLSIIVINPFYVNGTDGDCTWLATSNCNGTLSNKKWLIKGVSHQISAGSYTTTIKVMLPTPNVDVDRDAPLGGDGCGTESFGDEIPDTEPRT